MDWVLAKAGVGPDAKVSAALIHAQVTDLLVELDKILSAKEVHESDLLTFAGLLKFNLACEYLRGRAGWLLDDNKIHNTVYERVSEQLTELKSLCGDEFDHLPSQASSAAGLQYLHDSHEIAYKILELADSDFDWYEVAKLENTANLPNSNLLRNMGLFAVGVVLTALATAFIYYLQAGEEDVPEVLPSFTAEQ